MKYQAAGSNSFQELYGVLTTFEGPHRKPENVSMIGSLIKNHACGLAIGLVISVTPAWAADRPAVVVNPNTNVVTPKAAEPPTASARAPYKFIEGKGYVICEEMLKRLNDISARKPQGPVCGYDILRSIPGVTLPGWKRIDLQEDKALYMRVALAWGVDYRDWKAAFASPRPKPGTKFQFSTMPTDEDLEQGWQKRLRDPTFELYLLSNRLPRQEESDMSLITVFKLASDASRCKEVRSVLFSGDLKAPKNDWRSADPRYPFRHGNRWYEMAEGVMAHAVTSDVGIYWVQDHEQRERVTTPICNIMRKPG